MTENQMRENATPATEQLLSLVTSVLWVGKLVFCKDLRIQDRGKRRKSEKIARTGKESGVTRSYVGDETVKCLMLLQLRLGKAYKEDMGAIRRTLCLRRWQNQAP